MEERTKKILLNNILPPWKREPKRILLNIPPPGSQKDSPKYSPDPQVP